MVEVFWRVEVMEDEDVEFEEGEVKEVFDFDKDFVYFVNGFVFF